MLTDVLQWSAIAFLLVTVVPIWVGLRRCSIADLEQLRGAGERLNLWGFLRQPYQTCEDSLGVQVSVILVAIAPVYDGSFVEARFCRSRDRHDDISLRLYYPASWEARLRQRINQAFSLVLMD